MKKWSLLLATMALTACQNGPAPLPVILAPAPEPVKVVEPPKPAPVPLKPELALNDEVTSLQAWRDFRSQLLQMNSQQREQLSKSLPNTAVAALQQLLIKLHPETPYPVRFKAQMQFSEQISKLTPALADLFRWDHAYNQKLLESESAVKALSRQNGQQQDEIDRLHKQTKDLQKKIDALTQIEAGLNQAGGG